MGSIIEMIKVLEKKYKRSWKLNALLSITLFSLTAGLVILNLFAIRFNPAKEFKGYDVPGLGSQQIIFLVIICISTFTSFVGGIMHLFVFKKKAKQEADKIKRIRIEINQHTDQTGHYEDPITRDEVLIDKVTEILNMN